MPLFLHTGYDAWYGMEFTAEDIESIIAENPGMPVVLAHMIFPHLERSFGLLDRYENAWLDATNVPGSFVYAREKNIPISPSLLDTLIAGMERHRGRIMYGSDYPVSMGSLESVHRDMLALDLSDGTLRSVTGETPARFCLQVDGRRSALATSISG
jgi:predicted TIM-barrel fold metal-dependent hydrolase